MREREANRQSQDLAAEGRGRPPPPYESAEEAANRQHDGRSGGDEVDRLRREFRAVTGEEAPADATEDDLRAPEERFGLGQAQRPEDATGEG